MRDVESSPTVDEVCEDIQEHRDDLAMSLAELGQRMRHKLDIKARAREVVRRGGRRAKLAARGQVAAVRRNPGPWLALGALGLLLGSMYLVWRGRPAVRVHRLRRARREALRLPYRVTLTAERRRAG